MPLIQDSGQISLCFRRKPDLVSLARLEALLGIGRTKLRSLAFSAGAHYAPFLQSQKTKPFAKRKAPPKRRKIDNPTVDLKRVQRLINGRILKPIDLPSHIFGGVAGRTTLENVRQHLGAKVLIRVDIAHFFPSVTNVQVFEVWRDILGCSPRIASLLTKLTTFQRRLPQGAPTSTLLANLVLLMIDGPIRCKCQSMGIRYSSWVDDLAFSSDNPRGILDTVVATLRSAGFAISRRKLEIMGPRDRKVLNGIVLGNGLGVTRERISEIRSGIQKLRAGEISRELSQPYITSLRGRIAYVRTITPKKANILSNQLEALLGCPKEQHRRARNVSIV
jgi:RNA-directed DNA polymerase